MRKLGALLLSAALLGLSSGPTQAQQSQSRPDLEQPAEPVRPEPEAAPQPVNVCGGRAEVILRLRQGYGELPLLSLDNESKPLAVIFYNPDTGSWTLFRVQGEMLCALGAGRGATFGASGRADRPA